MLYIPYTDKVELGMDLGMDFPSICRLDDNIVKHVH